MARDLGIAFHEVGMEEFEEWKEKGFSGRPTEYKDLGKKEQDRLMGLMTGSAMRKGSRRR